MKNEQKKRVTIQCRVSAEEYKEIEKKATTIGLTVSSYLRMVCLMADVELNLQLPNEEDN